ncbi:Protein SERAC1 [Fusarium austroafricanum]|uniref:Protein SERAC1 n=1 Tax=Fusarium austroafricanum TaxID=2364996 RepID=A0A8H4NMI8_9HYPO|nr:Protein SERAC1 [Fusarium austroafricanum]
MGTERSIARYETTAVFTHPEAKADIVLVHGLNGSPDKTWTAKNGTFWPLDLLPTALRGAGAQANVLVYGYNADSYSKKNDRMASDNFIHQHAQNLVTNLMLHRRGEGTFKTPIIWVCHSLGGILVKRALLYSSDVREPHLEDLRSIFVSTFGLVFLGTPHVGSDAATWSIILQAMSDAVVPKRFFDSESVLLKTLKKDNETLANINSHFLDIYQRFQIHMVRENQTTDIKGHKIIIVDANSAGPQLPGVTSYGVEATHSGMCKFDNMGSPGFRSIAITMQQWIRKAPSAIQERWLAEEDEKRARVMAKSNEIMSPYTSQTQTPVQSEDIATFKGKRPVLGESILAKLNKNEPPFIHPERFRPNSLFRGRHQDLQDLHNMLMDPVRRNQGTSAVLVWSVPGGGKTHLAREYAFKHRHDYSCGVFWVRTKTPEDLEDGFLRIAKHARSRGEIEILDETTLQNPRKVIPMVRNWLDCSENWLLILDGALHDTANLISCIPDAKNSSLIITSTDTSIAGDHRFDNPQTLELGPLAENDARALLLEEMDRKRPWTQDDLERALEVVKLVEGLPLAIHAAAGQMKATKEPLSKYIRSYKKRPRAGGLGAYKAVREKLQERGETAALNLMYLLSFFGGRVPVELLALGLKALDKRTPVRTHDSMGKRSLNKTFTILIAFALIERDEIEDVPSVSTPGETISCARPMEPLDVLKIHGIVQSFFLEALKKDGQYNFWLERAAAVFLRSFEHGDSRANNNKEMGLPDDYRRYATHCRRILKHIQGIDKPSLELMAAEQALESRFEDIQVKIRTLARSMTTDSEGRWVRGPYVSVFEKSNSASLSSSFTNPEDENVEEQQTPWDLRTSFPSLEEENDVPYPHDSTIPAPAFYEDNYTRVGGGVSQQRVAEQVSSHNSPRISERDLHDSWTLIREPSDSRSRSVFDPIERGIRPALRGHSVGAIPRPQPRLQETIRERLEENPFMGSSSGNSAIPTMDIANADWLRQDHITARPWASHSDISLDADIDQWAPGLPITSNSVSSLRPVPQCQQPVPFHRRALSTGEVLSSSLPNSLASSTLRPPSSGPGGSLSQPMSRNSSTKSEQLAWRNPPFPMWARRVPSVTATEPSPRHSPTSFDNVPSGYQTWESRHSGPWNSEGAFRRDITSSPRPDAAAEAAEMVRSGSGGIQFNGRIVEFGRTQPTTTQPVYPLGIDESTYALESQATTRRRRNTNSQSADYTRPNIPS